VTIDSSIRVLVADNRTFVRIGVQNVLGETPDIVVVGTAAVGADALVSIERQRPEVVIVGDLDNPGTVIDAVDKAEMQILALVEGLGSAAGPLSPDASPSELTAAIRMLAAGYSLSRGDRRGWTDDPLKMTGRELDVLRLLARGYTNREISRKLALQESTVKSHTQSLFNRLCVRNRVSAVIYAYERGFVHAGENLGLVPPRSGSRYG
jgi:DNA-binding NarL/FixJ family response regulator